MNVRNKDPLLPFLEEEKGVDNAFHDFIIICVLVVFLVEKKGFWPGLSKLNLALRKKAPKCGRP